MHEALFLFPLRYGFVGLERRDPILDQFGRIGELLGLRVDAPVAAPSCALDGVEEHEAAQFR